MLSSDDYEFSVEAPEETQLLDRDNGIIKRGKRPLKFTKEMAEECYKLIGLGFSNATVADALGISSPSLSRLKEKYEWFSQGCMKAAAKGTRRGAGHLMKQIEDGSTNATMFWLRTRAREEFGEQQVVEGPAKVVVEVRDRTEGNGASEQEDQ